MAAGHVDRTVLESNYQQPGQTYLDTKTEGAFEVVAQQIDQNWDDYSTVKQKLASTTAGDSGAHNVASATIAGVAGDNVHAQISDLKLQINQAAVSEIPNGSLGPEKLSFSPITQAQLDAASVGSNLYAYRNLGGL